VRVPDSESADLAEAHDVGITGIAFLGSKDMVLMGSLCNVVVPRQVTQRLSSIVDFWGDRSVYRTETVSELKQAIIGNLPQQVLSACRHKVPCPELVFTLRGLALCSFLLCFLPFGEIGSEHFWWVGVSCSNQENNVSTLARFQI
jgi:hypothetical protein